MGFAQGLDAALYRVAGYVKGKRQITYHSDYPAALAKANELAKSINLNP